MPVPSKRTTSEPAPDEVVDAVVRALNELQRTATLAFALKVGEIIVKSFYNGSLGAWRTHTIKEASFRKLAARAEGDLQLSASSLYRSVAIYELCDRIDISTRKHLGLSHMRAILGLPSTEQNRLLVTANDKKWTVEQLNAEVSKLRRAGGPGRKPTLPIVKAVDRIERLVSRWQTVFSNMENTSALDRTQLVSLQGRVITIRRHLDFMEKQLRTAFERGGAIARPVTASVTARP